MASLLFSKPFQRSGHWEGARNSHRGVLGPETRGLWAQCGAGALQPVGNWDLKLSRPRQRSSSWAGSSASWRPVAVGGREENRVLSLEPTPPPHLQALAPVLTSALGTFLMDLTLLGALSPASSSEVSVRGSAWFVLDLKLKAGSSPGCGEEKENRGLVSLLPGHLLTLCPPDQTWALPVPKSSMVSRRLPGLGRRRPSGPWRGSVSSSRIRVRSCMLKLRSFSDSTPWP